MNSNEGAACAASVDLTLAGADGLIQLLPMGEFEAREHGRSYLVRDLAHAQQIVADTRAYHGATDIMVDYDHQSVFGVKPGVGGSAPAAGWIKPESLVANENGVFGKPEWTDRAAAAQAAREYRYLSPYFGFAKADGAVTKLVNVALTNRPAIEELAAVAASATNGDPMSLKNIAGALGLAETADEEAICAAISELKKPAEGAAAASATAQATLGKVAAALGVKADAKEDELVAAATQAKAAQPDPAQYAPKAVVDELQGQLKTLQEEQSERAATAAVDAAMAAGKVSPATKAWALNLAKGDPKSFEAYVAAAAVIVPPGERRPPGTPPAGEVSLTDEDKAACAAIGMSEDDFLKAKK